MPFSDLVAAIRQGRVSSPAGRIQTGLESGMQAYSNLQAIAAERMRQDTMRQVLAQRLEDAERQRQAELVDRWIKSVEAEQQYGPGVASEMPGFVPGIRKPSMGFGPAAMLPPGPITDKLRRQQQPSRLSPARVTEGREFGGKAALEQEKLATETEATRRSRQGLRGLTPKELGAFSPSERGFFPSDVMTAGELPEIGIKLLNQRRLAEAAVGAANERETRNIARAHQMASSEFSKKYPAMSLIGKNEQQMKALSGEYDKLLDKNLKLINAGKVPEPSMPHPVKLAAWSAELGIPTTELQGKLESMADQGFDPAEVIEALRTEKKSITPIGSPKVFNMGSRPGMVK